MKQLTQEQKDALSRDLPSEALKPHPSKKDSNGHPMTTIKAIFVIDRLNEVFGIGGWNLETTYLNHEKITRITQAGKERTEYISAVHTKLSVPEHGILLECVAGSTNDDLGDALKGGTTDGITKIASYLGIGANIWRANPPSRPTPPPAPAKPAATPKATPAKPATEAPKAPVPAKGGMVPNTDFDNQKSGEKPKPALPEGFVKDLEAMSTFEDLLAINKKYKSHFGDESLKEIMAAKMNVAFGLLPAEEQAKKPKPKN